jgi:hypothetical protein
MGFKDGQHPVRMPVGRGEMGEANELPEIKLTASARGYAQLTAPSLLIVLASIWRAGVTPDHRLDLFGWTMVVTLGLFVALIAARGVKPMTLVINAQGFSWTSLRRGQFQRTWEDIQDFALIPATRGAHPTIAFSYKPDRGAPCATA